MFIKRNLHLKNIERKRVAEGRNLIKGLRLDRNEKVDLWPSNLIHKVLKGKPSSFFSTYPEITNLYKKIAKFDKVNEDQILITSGIDGSIKNLLNLITKPKDVIAVLSPSYAMYEVYSKIFQLKLFKIGYTKNYEIKKKEFNKFFKIKPKILFLPNPNQPIENTFDLKEIKEIASRCKKINCFLVVDEAYYHFGAKSALPLLKNFKNLIILRTFSKAFGVPSIRAGYTISSKENMSVLSKARIAHELSSISIAVAEYLLDNYSIIKKNTLKIKISRKLLKKNLKKIGLQSRSQYGNYVLIKFNDAKKAKNVVKFLRKKFIYVKGPYKKPWDSFINISIGPYNLMKRFLAGLKEAKRRKLLL
tara:strand:+ start:832 stop:1914 length:1083 start_codon:yes stop_codon:yes gene_type:complete